MTHETLYQILDPLEQFDVIKLMPFINFGLTNLTIILLINLLLMGFLNYTDVYQNQSLLISTSGRQYKTQAAWSFCSILMNRRFIDPHGDIYSVVSSETRPNPLRIGVSNQDYTIHYTNQGDVMVTQEYLANNRWTEAVVVPPITPPSGPLTDAVIRRLIEQESVNPATVAPGQLQPMMTWDSYWLDDPVATPDLVPTANIIIDLVILVGTGCFIVWWLLEDKKSVKKELSVEEQYNAAIAAIPDTRQIPDFEEKYFLKRDSIKEKEAELVSNSDGIDYSKWKNVNSYADAMAVMRESKDLWLLPGIFISGTGLGEIATWLGFFAIRRYIRHQIKKLLQKEYKNLISLKVRTAKVFACLTPNALNSFFLMDAVWVWVWLVVIPNIIQYKQHKYKKKSKLIDPLKGSIPKFA